MVLPAVENTAVELSLAEDGGVVPEHFLALLHGIAALVLGAAVWSGMAAVFGLWSLVAAPGLGWLIAWACRHGGRRTDRLVRVTGWLLASAGVLLALFAFSAFSVTQTSPDSDFQIRLVGFECLRLFAEPPWLGSAAVVLALAGSRRALRDHPRRRETMPQMKVRARVPAEADPGTLRRAAGDSNSRAA